MVIVMLLRVVTLSRELVISLWTGSLDKPLLLLRTVLLLGLGDMVGIALLDMLDM